MTDVTNILNQIEDGDHSAAEELLPLLYDELRRLASSKLAKEKPGQTLQATALVHEAYLLLAGGENKAKWQSRGHFFAAAAEAMRRLLISNAIRKQRAKHGGDKQRVELDGNASLDSIVDDDILSLDEALHRLEAVDSTAAEVVKLKFFAGLTIPEIAGILKISARTADRRWAYARAWLHRDLVGK